MVDPSKANWRKSSRSGTNGCVEVAFGHDCVAVRDSKNRQGPVLIFTFDEWTSFLGGVRHGEFDCPKVNSSAMGSVRHVRRGGVESA